ncbi:hypothetical protein [Spongiimicrobium salis]|uniref:hypothetical protein n=1 Tax=Spongiimicrobium salis TaxID=1667022 RepID=UPI00374CBFF7
MVRIQKRFLNGKHILFLGLFLLCISGIRAQQTQTDSYTRYELLEPGTQSFRIIYDVSATTPGAKYYWNTLRKGSEHQVQAVWDIYSGAKLKWKIVSGKEAKKNGLAQAAEDTEYLQIALARPVPKNGESRLRIDKTYQDGASYFSENGSIVFSRTLGIKRNSVVLPKNYELTHCNYPVQVQLTSDARIKLSFLNRRAQAVPLVVKAKPLPQGVTVKFSKEETYEYDGSGRARNTSKARIGWDFEERAFQNREIVYFLQQPETHSFRLYHDYTESRLGVDRYLNIVRNGSKATDPSAVILDTGESLKVESLKGKEITAKGITLNIEINADTEVVAIWFDPVQEGESKRLRITETYTDANRYLLHNDQLIWDRTFGRNRNDVVLPSGWFLTTNSIPAIIDQTPEGQTILKYVNDRPDAIEVYIKAQRK